MYAGIRLCAYVRIDRDRVSEVECGAFCTQGFLAMDAPFESHRLREELARDGYTIVQNVLSITEADQLRSGLANHFRNYGRVEGLGKHQPNAAIEIPEIGWIFSHPVLIEILRKICGTPVTFTANCDAHSNMLSWWHKDLSQNDGGLFSGDCFSRAAWGVYRAGVYLQDHVVRYGLSVREGSHRLGSLTDGKPRTLSTRAGDVVFFDIRLTHAGQFADPIERLLLRAGRKLGRQSQAAALKERYRKLLRKSDKYSIFFTFGADCVETHEVCEFEIKKKRRDPNGAMYLDPEVATALTQAGVRFHPALLRADTTGLQPGVLRVSPSDS
jgi:hypothetical protein